MFGFGSRLQWDISKSLYLGAEVQYDHVNGAKTFNGLTTAAMGLGAPNSPQFVAGGLDTWISAIRLKKEFLP